MKVGFIGLGHMGRPMAMNLLKAKYDVCVYDVSKEAVDACTVLGASSAESIADLAERVDTVVTMVQTGDQIKKICLGDDGLFANLSKNSLYIDCSSIDINVTKSIHQAAKDSLVNMVEAPVSGGVAGAQAASLTIMVGGSEESFKRASEILNVMGKKIIHAGKAGSGQAAKICNNLLLGISMIGTCEAFNLAKKLALDPEKFFEISSNASGQCWSMTSYCPEPGILENVPSSNNYEPGFTANMMLKDLHLGAGAAESVAAFIPLGQLAEKIYQNFIKEGSGDKDFSGIMEFIKKQS